MTAHHARGVRRVAGHLDPYGTFVDDDHQQDLRRIRDRREPLQYLDAFEAFGGAQPRGDLVDGVGLNRRADLDAGEAAHLVVFGRGVAVDLNGGHDLRREDQGRPHGQRILTLALTSARL